MSESIIDIAAGEGRAVLGAALARHAPGEVVGVFQREIIRASCGLTDQIADLVIGINRILLRAVCGDSAAKSVIAVLRRLAVHALDRDETVHVVIGILDRLAVGIGHGGAVAVAVVGIAHGLAIGLGNGEQAARVVILVEGIALRCGDGGQQAKLVVSIRLGLFARVVRRKNIAGLVVGIENQGAGSG